MSQVAVLVLTSLDDVIQIDTRDRASFRKESLSELARNGLFPAPIGPVIVTGSARRTDCPLWSDTCEAVHPGVLLPAMRPQGDGEAVYGGWEVSMQVAPTTTSGVLRHVLPRDGER